MAGTISECSGCGRDLRTIPHDEDISKVLTERGPAWLCAECYERVGDSPPSDIRSQATGPP